MPRISQKNPTKYSNLERRDILSADKSGFSGFLICRATFFMTLKARLFDHFLAWIYGPPQQALAILRVFKTLT